MVVLFLGDVKGSFWGIDVNKGSYVLISGFFLCLFCLVSCVIMFGYFYKCI